LAILVDTNVLLLTVQRGHEWHEESVQAVKKLLASNEIVCVFLQNITEFWNVCTRPFDKNGLGLSVLETEDRLKGLDSILTMFPDTAAVYPYWRNRVVQHEVKGVQVYDARLAAAMQAHGIAKILTYNPGDFKRFATISVVHPRDVK
jgi:predicted nucleic acid-binding protein